MTVPAGAAGTPKSSPAVARFSEYCGLQVDGVGYVQTPPTSDSRYFGRFYVLPQLEGSGTVDLMVAYSNGAGNPELFKISFDGSDFVFDVTGGGSTSVPAFRLPSTDLGWSLVEFEYNAGGDFNIWVDEEWDFAEVDPAYAAISATIDSGPDTPAEDRSVAFVRLGIPNDMGGFTGGTVTYDAFEAHRSTNVGALLIGDVTAPIDPNVVDIFDVVAVVNEAKAPNPLNTGQPDCTRDGEIDIFDVVCVVNIARGN